jgi:NAD(P)-dependent dehydrogenase (short-subunit alcohol dehydrogenase family)
LAASARLETILITGTTSGLGLALLKHYSGMGHPVTAVNRRHVAELEAEVPGVTFVVTDISDGTAVDALFKEWIAAARVPDIFILNAGINEVDHAHALDLIRFDQVMRTNLSGTLTFVSGVQNYRLEGRKVVGISSVATIVPSSKNLGYYVSKLAIRRLFELFSRSDPGNHYQVLLLGPIATRMTRDLSRPAGLAGKIFDYFAERPEDEAIRAAKFISSRGRVLHAPAMTRAFYFLVKIVLSFVPRFYYQPHEPVERG